MARKPKQEDHENLERWLVSYADFITLLFAFFVVLYAMSSLNEGKYKTLTESLISAFRTDPRSLTPIELGEIRIIRETNIISKDKTTANAESSESTVNDFEVQRSLELMADEIEKAMASLIEENYVEVRRFDNWLEVEINTSILFPSGSAHIVPNAVPILREIATILRRFPNPINVEGFTDSLPINTAEFPSNWELSAGRAASVVHLFTNQGVEPQRMAALGYGEHHAIADNNTDEGRAKNRRVVLVILGHPRNPERKSFYPSSIDLPPLPEIGNVAPPPFLSTPLQPGNSSGAAVVRSSQEGT